MPVHYRLTPNDSGSAPIYKIHYYHLFDSFWASKEIAPTGTNAIANSITALFAVVFAGLMFGPPDLEHPLRNAHLRAKMAA